MNKHLFALLLFIILSIFAAPAQMATDLRTSLLNCKAKVIGFTAIHGSAKTETAELRLVESVYQYTDHLFYFPEIDMAMAHYFNRYLESGDELLLKELIYDYRYKVPQEASIETFEKWKSLRSLCDGKKMTVIGVDLPGSYKYTAKLVYEMVDPNSDFAIELKGLMDDQTANYVIGAKSELNDFFDKLYADFIADPLSYKNRVSDPAILELLLKNIESSHKVITGSVRRDRVMAENYKYLDSFYRYSDNYRFFRMGVYHMMRDNFSNMYPGFIAIVIQEGMINGNDAHIIMGLLHESSVMGMRRYNDDGEFAGCQPESGDEWTGGDLVFALGTDKYILSDLTHISLAHAGLSDMDMNTFPWKPLESNTLSDYLDACIVISESPAAVPIEKYVN